jgi:ATP-binding cassette, subfamily B, bacterial PglK
MFKLVLDLFKNLEKKQRVKFYKLQMLVIMMVFFEVIGISLIAPFIAIATDKTVIFDNEYLNYLYSAFNSESPEGFIITLGSIVLFALFFSSVLSMFTTWRMSLFAMTTGAEISDRLYSYYMRQSWCFHSQSSSSQLTKKIANETQRMTTVVLQPLMVMNAKLLLIIGMSCMIFFINPFVALIGFLFFVFAYLVLFKFVKKRLQNNGDNISNILTLRYQLMNEGFGGVKDLMLLNRTEFYIKRFEDSGKLLAYSMGANNALALTPRYLMELIAFGSMVVLILFYTGYSSNDLTDILPILSVYAFAAFKILPAFQNVYTSLAEIRGNLSAYSSVREDLINSKNFDNANSCNGNNKISNMHFNNEIRFDNVSFKYEDLFVLQNINISIHKNKVYGIVGPSGSGKSTLVDVLLGLLKPSGKCYVDEKIIDSDNLSAWQSLFGYVPQSIFLTEQSILENIAFGVVRENIDYDSVRRAAKLAHLEDFILSLDKGFDTLAGERGVQLSGGQRQRIGIARALYHDPEIIVFDEATSALDGITEKVIMDAIHDLNGSKTIIMIAHRLKTIRECDHIFFINEGCVFAQGTYDELLQSTPFFKKMDKHS